MPTSLTKLHLYPFISLTFLSKKKMKTENENSTGNYKDLGATGYSFADHRQREGAVLDPDVDLGLGEFLSDDEDLQCEMLMDMMDSQETTEEYLSLKIVEKPKKGERYIFNFENSVQGDSKKVPN